MTNKGFNAALPTLWVILYLVVNSAAVARDDVDVHTNRTGSAEMIQGSAGTLVAQELALKLALDDSTWHFTPWHYTRTKVLNNVLVELECVPSDSAASFPDGILTDEQLAQGGFMIYVFFGLYSFTLLAIVCNDYFIPCVELICEHLNIPTNVAAATFMAVATSCPEFFVNVISTFLTESDMGVGTIVGSALFNALGVATVGGLAANRPIALEARPVTRDVLVYMCNVAVLVGVVWDGRVVWYESVALAILYVLYFVVMFNSERAFRYADRVLGRISRRDGSDADVAENGKNNEGIVNESFNGSNPEIRINGEKQLEVPNTVQKSEGEAEATKLPKSLWRYPSERSAGRRAWWLFLWPLKFLLSITIPSPKTYPRWYPFAFFMCICWIGANSYLVSWSMTIIGSTFLIPDSIMGMTFLAFGGCLPEACSIYIMSRRGEGGIGVSNALGANSLAILFALGMPWFIRSMLLLAQGSDEVIVINSSGIEYIIISLFLAVASLWLVLKVSRFTLRKAVGAVTAVLYLCFITFAILVEMGIILGDGVPRCW